MAADVVRQGSFLFLMDAPFGRSIYALVFVLPDMRKGEYLSLYHPFLFHLKHCFFEGDTLNG